jgi:hypothetical protein
MGNQAEITIDILLRANLHLMEIIKSQVEQHNYKLYKIEGQRSIEENVENRAIAFGWSGS